MLLFAYASRLSSPAYTPGLSLVELTWLPAGSDRVAALTSRPVACLASPETPEIAAKLRLGKLVFNSPALLGGQAEKKGLSCNSCHRNGRDNRHFQFEAVSGPPGTADVTSGLFSQVRADNMFNPKPIPDLALPEGHDQVARTDRKALAGFVEGLIEEEFSADPTPPPLMDALLTYLEHIDSAASTCVATAYESRTWHQDWDDARLASAQAHTLAGTGQDGTLKAFYTRTARISLRRLHERYAGAEHSAIRADLVYISRSLGKGDPWPSDRPDLKTRLESAANSSLYSPDVLARALKLASP